MTSGPLPGPEYFEGVPLDDPVELLRSSRHCLGEVEALLDHAGIQWCAIAEPSNWVASRGAGQGGSWQVSVGKQDVDRATGVLSSAANERATPAQKASLPPGRHLWQHVYEWLEE